MLIKIFNVKEYHKSRRMFCIINKKLIIALKNIEDLHDEWLIKSNFIKSKEEMYSFTRGVVDKIGDIYFCSGNDFKISEENVVEFFNHLSELVEKLSIKRDSKIFGGMIKGRIGEFWKTEKNLELFLKIFKNNK